MKKYFAKNLSITAMCVAMGIVLPMAFHAIPNAGSIFLPMHIPILICGFIAGWKYGIICGILTPCLSSVLTGMPPAAYLPSMICELAVYGLVSGIMAQNLKIKNIYLNIYFSLITAMISGRVVMGIMNALIFRAGSYKFSIWITASFITSLPGIIIQMIFIPAVILGLNKAEFIKFGEV